MVAADLAMCERELDKPRADAGRDDLEVHEARKAVARAEVERLRQQMAVLQHRLASISGSLPRFAV
jgi:outer membrane protein TolC